jgi:hypothetical protein
MMNPWDNERTWQEGAGDSAPSKSSGLIWLVAVVIAVVGLALLSKRGFNDVAVIPVGISLFFMVMFLISHRRETRRIAWKREFSRMQQAQQQIQQVQAPRPAQTAVDTTLRKVFDRYDLKVINHGRSYGWSPDRIAGFLDYARDYVDTQHAGTLINGNEKGELDRHLDAALQRALLQHDIEHKTDSKSMETPF